MPPWTPLLEGDLADRARATVDDIAAAIAADAGEDEDSRRSASLAGGRAGRALFHAYLAQATGAEAQADLAARRLEEAVDELASAPMGPGLYSGFTGIAWATEHLQGRLFEAGDEDPNEEIDRALADLLDRSPWTDIYDLIGGLVGFGIYAVERLPHPGGVECLDKIVARLGETAERRDGGVTWFTPPHHLPAHAREQTPDGYYNLGVAHGVPGVVALLADAVQAGVREAEARELLEGTVAWLLAQKLGGDAALCFAYATTPGGEARAARLAWCYGDPGIAATLLHAARAVGRADWEREALAIIGNAAAAPDELAGVRDAGLCHGAAGLAHIYNRMYQATGDERLAAAARHWYEHTLDMRLPGQGIAGFLSWEGGIDTEPTWVADSGFLTGATGVGLALLAATSDVEPEWDRVLQVDVPR